MAETKQLSGICGKVNESKPEVRAVVLSDINRELVVTM
jgi:hypothetical protein